MNSAFDPEICQKRLFAILDYVYRDPLFGPGLSSHASLVALYASATATELGGDGRIAYLAGWLFNIGATMGGSKEHHKTRTEVAEKILKGVGFPIEIIRQVLCCLGIKGEETIESRCVASAAGLANFFRVSDLLWFAFVRLGLGPAQGAEWVEGELQKGWENMLPQHRKLLDGCDRVSMVRNFGFNLKFGDEETPSDR
ncbi:MAG: hypothetical protein Q7S60_01435 [bacterium]|nr:hypothetical protein [bacterium]